MYPKGSELNLRVPLFDLTRQYHDIQEEVMQNIHNIFCSGNVILGKNVGKFEEEMAQFLGVRHAIGVANGSDALLIAVKALGIEEGDLVITTPYTFFATASCITRNGAVPIFADIDPVTFNINLDHVEEILNTHEQRKKIKAVIPVHLFGRTVNLERLENLRKKYGIKIIEDCAQSIGSTWRFENGIEKFSSNSGDLSTFSFFPTKNLGAYGDAGLIATNDDSLADFCRMYRVHGSKERYHHDVVGINSRLDEIQAAVLRTKLTHLAEYTEKRKKIARIYEELFGNSRILKSHIEYPAASGDNSHIFHQYVVRIKGINRDGLRKHLAENEIGTSIYYPIPLHLQKCFDYLGYRQGDLPVSEKACTETLALPIFPELRREEVEYVTAKIEEFISFK